MANDIWQRVCARCDLGWDWREPSLASLHANPAHSALRRARCFEDAADALARFLREHAFRGEDEYPDDSVNDAGWVCARWEAEDAQHAMSGARRATLRSVR